MVRQLTSSERQSAAAIAFAVLIVGGAMAVFGRSDPLGVHGVIVILFAAGLLYLVMSSFTEPEPTEDREASYYDDPIKVGIVLVDGLGGVRDVHGRLGGGAARVARPRVRCCMVELRPAEADAHYRRYLRLRRQCADRDLLPRRPAHLAGAPRRAAQPLVRAFRLQLCSACWPSRAI